MPRFRAARAAQITQPPPTPAGVAMTLQERRRRAFDRVWPLLSTSIPTADLAASYLDEVLQPCD